MSVLLYSASGTIVLTATRIATYNQCSDLLEDLKKVNFEMCLFSTLLTLSQLVSFKICLGYANTSALIKQERDRIKVHNGLSKSGKESQDDSIRFTEESSYERITILRNTQVQKYLQADHRVELADIIIG